MELTTEQKRAVESKSQYIAIIAGAGSGKTKTLTERICNLILHKNIQSDEILALTFSVKAAQEMQKRITEKLGEKAKGIWIKTFHSFGLELLKMNYQNFDNHTERFEIIDTTNKTRHIKSVINLHKLESFPKDILHTISQIKNKIIECDKSFEPIFYEYNKLLRENNLVDLDDLIWLTVDIIKNNPNIKTYLHKRFKHVLIDEYQDTNDIQNEMINLILSPSTSLCVVGDDDQCIYEWRGSKPQYIREFATRTDVETIFLSENFRSQNYVVELANKFIANNNDRIPKSMNPQINSKIKPSFYRFDSVEAEASFIAKTIKQLYDSGIYKYNDIAILVRSTLQNERILYALNLNGISFNTKQEDVNTEFSPFLTVLYSIINYKYKNNIARAINFPDASLDNFTYMDLVEDNGLEKLSTIDCLEYLYNSSITWNQSDVFKCRYSLIKRLYEHNTTQNFKASDIISELVNYYKSEKNEDETTNKDILNIIKLQKIAENWESTTSVPSLRCFVDYVVCAIENNEELYCDKKDDSVNVMTCHRAKGLEFPVVIIPGVNVGTFPNDYFISSKNDLEQERRLFYVAMTRAIERLIITCNEHPYATKNNTYIEKGFIAEIPEIIKWSKTIVSES